MKSYLSHRVYLEPDEEIDFFLNGKIKIIQSKHGYRFSVDAVFLSRFATVRKGDTVVDLGTGCGIILLLLLYREKDISVAIGLEIQKELASQAYRNSILNGFEKKMHIIVGDIRRPPFSAEFADLVVCNPPYRPVKSGRINPDISKAIARHEILLSLDDIINTSRRILKKKGRLCLIYPAERMAEVIAKLKKGGFEIKRVQIAYPDLSSRASLVLIESYLGAKPGLIIEPPIVGQGESLSFSVH